MGYINVDKCYEIMKNQIKTRPWLANDLIHTDGGIEVNEANIDLRMNLIKGMREAAFYMPMTDYDEYDVQARYITAIAGKNVAAQYDLPEIELWFSRQIDLWKGIIDGRGV